MQALSEIHALYFITSASYFKLNINFKDQKKVKLTSQKKNNEIVLNKTTS